MQLVGLGLVILLVIVLIAGAGGYVYLRRSLPQLAGTVQVSGLSGSVEIIRDVDVIPHIYAQNERDTLFGLGYVHAQDRLWQMEFQRRIGNGRLSEILGESTLATDRFLRTLGVHRAARSAWEELDPDTRTDIDAYVAGINAFVDNHNGSALPPEFTILGVQPERWSGPDVLVWSKMMAWDLGGNYATELLRNDIVRAVGPERAAELLPGDAEDGPAIVTTPPAAGDYSGLIALGENVRSLMGVGGPNGEGLGSNNWVVDATKSTTGAPLLADDPHLGTRIPSIWYLAHLSGGNLDVIGASIPGLPSMLIGRNRSIAWGVTNVGPDVQDLFKERLDASGTAAEFQGQFEPMQIITETIEVKDAPAVQQQVRITRHGPLISDALNANDDELPSERRRPAPLEPLAFRWTALDADDSTAKAFLDINRAQNWDAFREALRSYVAPSQNFVYADINGNIGYYAPGRFPIRASGDGTMPAEGWSGTYEWTGTIPFEELPQAYNPPEHFIATANNRPVPAEYPYFLGREWAPRYRAQRIVELLQAKPVLSPDDFAAIQADVVSLQSRELIPLLLPFVTPESEDERNAIALLQSWDGTASGDSAAAALYAAWYQRLPRALVGDELGSRLIDTYEARSSFVSRFLPNALQNHDSPWCDDTETDAAERCGDIVNQAFREALNDIQTRLGRDTQAWRWDRLHQTIFPHQPFDNVSALQRFFSRSVPNGGDGSTVNVGPFGCQRNPSRPSERPQGERTISVRVFTCEQPFQQRSIPGFRQVIDLSKMDGGRFIQSVGQSGHVLSPHYDDYLSDWQAVRYRPMRFERATVERDQQAILRLEPQP
jgi:penicillin amidase